MVDYSKVHVHFCIPCYAGQLCEATFTSFLKFALHAQAKGLTWSLDTMVNESLISRGRNNLVAKMLFNKNATHLMFIDSDIRFEPEDIFKLVDADKDLVAGLYPMKAYPIQFVINSIPGAPQEGSLEEVSKIGTGFMMISRTCIDKMIAAYPEEKYEDSVGLGKQFEPYMYALFDTKVVDGKYLSEDWLFCHRWRELGGKVWAHKEILLNHTGYHEFRGAEVLERQRAKEAAEKAAASGTS